MTGSHNLIHHLTHRMQTLIDFFDSKDLMPHGYCLSWDSLLLWLHVASDLLLALSFYLIPLCLIYFIRQRKDFSHSWLLASFAGFIVACGTTHLLSVITIWLPVYWLQAYIKVFTALLSMMTTVTTIWLVRFALTVPSPEQLQAEIDRNKLIDEERRIALERLEKIASRVPGMVYTLRLFEDGRSCIPYSNDAIIQLFRLTPAQVCEDASAIFACIYPDDLERVMNSIHQSAQNLLIWRCEFRVQFDDSTVLWLSTNSIPQHEQGSTLWHGFITDITEQKQAESLKAVMNQLYNKIPDYDQQREPWSQESQYIPDSVLKKWQESADLLADMINVPAVLIMKINNEMMELVVSSQSENNPYQVGNKEKRHDLYCETVINTQRRLLVPNATADKLWDKNPDIKRGMIAYLGYPINFPNNRPFGTLCVLDHKENHFSAQQERILQQFKNVIETDLAFLEQQSHLVNINQTLRASETRLAALFSKMTNGFALHEVIRDAQAKVVDYVFLDVNPAFEKMTGIARENWIGKRIKEILPHTEDYWIDNYANVVDSGEPRAYENYASNIGRWFSTYAYKTAPEQFAALVQDVTEAKQTEQALRESELKFRTLAESVPQIIWIAHADGRIIYVNQQGIDYTGLSLENVLGLGWITPFHPDDKERVWNAWQQSIQTGGEYNLESRLRRIDGVYRWWLIRGVPVRDEQGNTLNWFGTCTDIDDLKRVESHLIESEQRFRSLVNNTPDYIVRYDRQHRHVFANEHTIRDSGRTPEEFIGKTHREMGFSDHLCALCEAAIERCFTTETIQTEIFEWDNVNGTVDIEWRVIPEYNSLGVLETALAIARNITESKRAQQALVFSEEKYRTLYSSLRDGLVFVDMQGNIKECNQPYANMLGYSQEELTKFSYIQITPEKWHSLEAGIIRRQVLTTGQSELYEKEYIKKDGTVFPIELRAWLIKDSQGNAKGMWAIVRDITERKRVLQHLEQSESRFRQTFEYAPIGVANISLDGHYMAVNQTYCDIVGYSREELLTMTFIDVTQKQDRVAHIRLKQQLLAGVKESFCLEKQYLRQDGSVVWGSLSVRLSYDKEGLANYFIATVEDITTRQHIQNEILATKNKLQATLKAIPDLLFELDLDMRYCDLHAPRPELLAVPPEQILGKTVTEILPPDAAATYWEALQETLQQGHSVGKQIKLELDQETHWFELSVAMKATNDEQQPHFIMLSRDVTKRKYMEEKLRENENMLNTILDSVDAYIYIKDKQYRYQYANRLVLELFNQPLEAIMGKTDADFFDTATARNLNDNDRRVIEFGERVAKEEINTGKDKHFYHTYLSIKQPLRYADGSIYGLCGISSDITERKKMEAELRIAATVFDAQEGMLISDANEIILNVNQAFTVITGYSAEEVIGETPRLLCSGRHDQAFYSGLWQSIKETGAWRGEIWNRRKNGQIYPEWLTITAVKGNNENEVTHYVATFTDITESKSFEEHIHRLAFYDPLTKLPNRRLLQERLKHAIEVSHRKGTQLAVLMLDLDKFKIVNDTLGHVAGDELLQQVADCIKVHVREVDTVARLDGDDFIVLVENVEHYEQVTRIANNIIHALSQVYLLNKNHHITISTSIGISIYPEHGEDVETLLNNADAALYHAKDQGRGCFAYFSEDLTRQARERIALELRLRRAIEQQELSVYFQPQVDIRTGQIIGAEALVRWYDSVNARYIMPCNFIGLAEETGLIISIGEWVLRETCRLGRQWLDQGLPALVLAVNVSPYQFRRCDINALVNQVLEDTGFPVEYLELEITESGLMENQAHAMNILNNLHTQGVRLAIDDFGTGYSSLAYLKYFPLDVLKIDKTFIDDIPFLQGDMTITATIISMAHHLGFKVLAEGVETQEQLDFLQQHGCDVYQGYLYSKPLPADEFAKILLNSAKKH